MRYRDVTTDIVAYHRHILEDLSFLPRLHNIQKGYLSRLGLGLSPKSKAPVTLSTSLYEGDNHSDQSQHDANDGSILFYMVEPPLSTRRSVMLGSWWYGLGLVGIGVECERKGVGASVFVMFWVFNVCG